MLHTLEMEIGENGIEELLNLCVHQIADTALMSVMDILVGQEIARFDVEPHLLVGITEGHTIGGKAVDLLYGEHRIVHRIVEDMLVYLYLVDDICSHLQAVFEFVERWQEHFLDNLKVAEVTYRQIVHYQCHLLRQRLEFVALGSDEFENLRILLVRHDRRTSGALLR